MGGLFCFQFLCFLLFVSMDMLAIEWFKNDNIRASTIITITIASQLEIVKDAEEGGGEVWLRMGGGP